MMKLNKLKVVAVIYGILHTTLLLAQDEQKAEGTDLDHLKINQVQVLGTHNSYAQPVDSALLAYADPVFQQITKTMTAGLPPDKTAAFKEFHPNTVNISEGLKYNHPPFDVQLDKGIRSLEMDVYYDPTGNRFNHPAGYQVLQQQGISNLATYKTEGLDKPGFKLLHIADFDFRTHHVTFREGLSALKKWSDGHPGHFPVFILVEAKDKGIPLFPDAAQELPFNDTAFEQLDQEVSAVLGREKLVTPDDVRGNYPTLKEAVLAGNWPMVQSAKGKFIFLLLPASAGMDMESAYVKGRPNLEGRMMFVQSVPENSFAAFILLDNAIVRQQEIQDFVQQGYLVRTRADIETYEAKVNDHSRAEAAFSSGAQVVSTDFFQKGNTYGTGYYVQLPGGNVARPNPVNAPGKK